MSKAKISHNFLTIDMKIFMIDLRYKMSNVRSPNSTTRAKATRNPMITMMIIVIILAIMTITQNPQPIISGRIIR